MEQHPLQNEVSEKFSFTEKVGSKQFSLFFISLISLTLVPLIHSTDTFKASWWTTDRDVFCIQFPRSHCRTIFQRN